MKWILFILVGFISFSGFSQSANKKRILVIPYNRMEFDSEFSLEEIAEINKIETSEVFQKYQEMIIHSFTNYSDENFEFVSVNKLVLKPLKRYIKYEYGKYQKKKYYATNLNLLDTQDFTQLMNYHKADFVLFINWYDIDKESVIAPSEKKKRKVYAGHYIDYDIYNLFKQKVLAQGKEEAKMQIPLGELIPYKSLRLIELKEGYKYLASQIIKQLNKPIQLK